MTAKQLLKKTGRAISKKSPVLLAGLGIVGVVTTAVLAARQTPKAEEVLDESEDELEKIENDYKDHYISEKQYKVAIRNEHLYTVKQLGKVYLPAIISGGLTITSIIFSHRIQYRRQAALTGALNMTQAALWDYKSELKSLMKPKEYEKLEQQIAEKHIKTNPPDYENIEFTGHGTTLFLDDYSHRYFRSNPEWIRHVMLDLTDRIRNENYADLNEYYSLLPLPYTTSAQDVGWNCDDGVLNPVIRWINYTNPLTGADEPCGVVRFSSDPHPGFDSLY